MSPRASLSHVRNSALRVKKSASGSLGGKGSAGLGSGSSGGGHAAARAWAARWSLRNFLAALTRRFSRDVSLGVADRDRDRDRDRHVGRSGRCEEGGDDQRRQGG